MTVGLDLFVKIDSMEDFIFPHLRYSIKQKYPSTISDDDWGMDNTHVMILFNLLLAYPYKRALDVGSHRGFSAT